MYEILNDIKMYVYGLYFINSLNTNFVLHSLWDTCAMAGASKAARQMAHLSTQ